MFPNGLAIRNVTGCRYVLVKEMKGGDEDRGGEGGGGRGLSTHYVTSHPLTNEKEKPTPKKVNR